jgi:hypothetical protein
MDSEIKEENITISNAESQDFWFKDNLENFSWTQKVCIYHDCLWKYINVPDNGLVMQLGCGFGLSLEKLSHHFPNRTWGIDLFNPTNHPLIKIKDIRELEDIELAYVHCNVGNFIMTPKLRKFALEYSLRNLIKGGYCVTAGNSEYVENHLGWKIKDIAKKYECEVYDMPNDDSIIAMNKQGKYNSGDDCLIKKI